MNGTPPKKGHFYRTKEVFSGKDWKQVALAVASLSALVFSLKSLFGIFFPDFVAWLSTILPLGLLAYVYNAIAQSQGKDIRHAFILDWVDLSVYVHLLILVGSVVSLYVSKFILSVFTPAGNQELKDHAIIASYE